MTSTKCIDRPTNRRGIGAATMLSLAVPGILLASGLALALQSSSARRFTSSAWASYVAGELAEGALAEAAHATTVSDLFDPAVFGTAPKPEVFAEWLLKRMVEDQAPRDATTDLLPNLPRDRREYRAVMRGGETVRTMFTAFRFPARRVTVKVPGVARKIAARNPGVRVERPADLAVTLSPISFRREYYTRTDLRFADPMPRAGMREAPGPGELWVSWGVVRLAVRVRVDDLRGPVTHELEVDRRFTIRSDVKPGEDALKISSVNLRAAMRQVSG